MRPDLQPEMRALLMRNGMQAHVVPVGDSYQLVVQGHDSPLLRYPISRQQMQALSDWGTNHANKKAYETFTAIIKDDFDMPRNFVHARNANGRVAMGLHGYRIGIGEYGRVGRYGMPPPFPRMDSQTAGRLSLAQGRRPAFLCRYAYGGRTPGRTNETR